MAACLGVGDQRHWSVHDAHILHSSRRAAAVCLCVCRLDAPRAECSHR